jgi:hypothetical protein
MVKGTFGFSSVNNNVVVDTGNTDAATGSSLHLNSPDTARDPPEARQLPGTAHSGRQ